MFEEWVSKMLLRERRIHQYRCSLKNGYSSLVLNVLEEGCLTQTVNANGALRQANHSGGSEGPQVLSQPDWSDLDQLPVLA